MSLFCFFALAYDAARKLIQWFDIFECNYMSNQFQRSSNLPLNDPAKLF